MHKRRQLLFVQGGGKGAHDAWDDRLVDSLGWELGPAWSIHYPRMPDEDDPTYGAWKPALERVMDELPKGSVLIGHSVGGTVLMKLLAEHHARKPGAIVLLAPAFVGDGGWSSDDLEVPPDIGARLPKGVPIHIFQGMADDVVPPAHVDLYAQAVPQAHIHRLPGRDHQLNQDLQEVAEEIRSLSVH